MATYAGTTRSIIIEVSITEASRGCISISSTSEAINVWSDASSTFIKTSKAYVSRSIIIKAIIAKTGHICLNGSKRRCLATTAGKYCIISAFSASIMAGYAGGCSIFEELGNTGASVWWWD